MWRNEIGCTAGLLRLIAWHRHLYFMTQRLRMFFPSALFQKPCCNLKVLTRVFVGGNEIVKSVTKLYGIRWRQPIKS